MQKKKVTLACTECKRKNYTKNKSSGNLERLQIKKFCSQCKNNTLHKEEK